MRVDRQAPLALLLFASLVLSSPLAAQDATPPGVPAVAGEGAPDSACGPVSAEPPCSTFPLRRIGDGVTPPVVIFRAHPQFTEQARKAGFDGAVTVTMIVDACGRPQDVHVLRGAGMGLDESAVEAVKHYVFKPAMLGHQPVPVELNIAVTFQISPPPTVLFSVPLEPTAEAWRNKARGLIIVALTVDTKGLPQNVHVLRGIGMGMDERAVKAVKQYHFQPFVVNGQPVARSTTIELKVNAK
jgi:TonB family protein